MFMILLKKGCREHRITETHVLNRELQSNIGVSYQLSYILEHGPTKLKPLFNGQLMYQKLLVVEGRWPSDFSEISDFNKVGDSLQKKPRKRQTASRVLSTPSVVLPG